MACLWCGENLKTNKDGYCESCNKLIRDDIKHHKTMLEDLLNKSNVNLPEIEKTVIKEQAQISYKK